MRHGWTEAGQASCTTGTVVCAEVGCTRAVYYDGRCSDHHEVGPPPQTCGHHPIVMCGCCNRVVCAACYGPWNALACNDCRVRARA